MYLKVEKMIKGSCKQHLVVDKVITKPIFLLVLYKDWNWGWKNGRGSIQGKTGV